MDKKNVRLKRDLVVGCMTVGIINDNSFKELEKFYWIIQWVKILQLCGSRRLLGTVQLDNFWRDKLSNYWFSSERKELSAIKTV
jgi:hypothetical protein